MEAKFYPSTVKDGKIEAFADVDIVEGITVRGFRVVKGSNGLFAAVPSRPVNVGGETRYYHHVAFANSSKRQAFFDELLEAYARWTKDGAPSRGSEPLAVGSPVEDNHGAPSLAERRPAET